MQKIDVSHIRGLLLDVINTSAKKTSFAFLGRQSEVGQAAQKIFSESLTLLPVVAKPEPKPNPGLC